MRILNSVVLLDPVKGGGVAERTYQMSKAFAESGADVSVITTDLGLSAERISSLGKVKVVALPVWLERFYVVRFSWARLKRLVNDADIIHLMGHWNMINVLLYFLAKLAQKPYVICPAGELILFGRSTFIKRIFNLLIGYRIVQGASGHVAVTPDECPIYGTYGISQDRVSVIPNGINPAEFISDRPEEFRCRHGLGNAPFVLFVGRLNPIKGPDLLLTAFISIADKLPDYHLVFAGPDGGLQDELQGIVMQHGLAHRIHFVGFISGDEKSDAYHAADLLVIPSRHEAMSIVVLEAGICGTPVLITDRCGFDEVASVAGGRVVSADSEAIAAGLCEMLAVRSNLLIMGSALKNLVQQNYSWHLIGQRYLALFDDITRVAKKRIVD